MCLGGVCEPGVPVVCDDGDPCNGAEMCLGGVCEPGVPVVCDDGDTCNGVETCDGGGCQPGIPVVCDDGDACNGVETCTAGACQPGLPPENSCGATSGAPGCSDPLCCQAVCGIDPFCCEAAWDEQCITAAADLCAPPPTCGDAACDGDEDCASCPDDCGPCAACPGAGGDCLTDNGTPGCDDVPCCEAVCSTDPFCCEAAWDQLCADAAQGLCAPPPVCGDATCSGDEDCASCPDDCGPCAACPGAGGDCLADNGTPGCDDVPCCEAVCSTDPFCCEAAWDSQCASEAMTTCGEPPGCEPSCDDGNPCTADLCDPELSACVHLPSSGELCGGGQGGCWEGQCYALVGDILADPIVLTDDPPTGVMITMQAHQDDYELTDCPGWPSFGAGTPDSVVAFVAPATGDYLIGATSPQMAGLALVVPDLGGPGTCLGAAAMAEAGTFAVLGVSLVEGQIAWLIVENFGGPGGEATVMVELSN
jgi:hypothetical protein